VKTFTMIGYELKRVFRDRSNWFFLFIFPMLLILVLGASFGSASASKVGVVAQGVGPLGEDLVSRLRRAPGIEVSRERDQDAVRKAVERGQLEAAVIVPAGYDGVLRGGGMARLLFVARPDAMGLRTTVASAVAGQDAVVRAARFAEREGTALFDQALSIAQQSARGDPGITVDVRTAGTAALPQTPGRFDAGASSQLILFVFLMSMMSAVALIEARGLGVVRRVLSTPTPARSVLLSQGLSRLAISLLQALVIMAGSALLFGVHWGSPAGAGLLVVSFALVGTGAGMLLGATLRTEPQAAATSLLLGLGLGALGGCMVPIEIFPDTMRTLAHVTPHAWALEGFAELVRGGAGVAAVLPQLGVLLGFAAVLLTAASWRLRRAITD
jgi:ABC-2 type transport system permease protein